ncbi:hypothetical protein [Lysinibacillus sp. HST-98]|nr:hypothetical protein [Lysinibacillus sp. HST-98]
MNYYKALICQRDVNNKKATTLAMRSSFMLLFGQLELFSGK